MINVFPNKIHDNTRPTAVIEYTLIIIIHIAYSVNFQQKKTPPAILPEALQLL